MFAIKTMQFACIASIVLTLTGCGGGGSSDSAPAAGIVATPSSSVSAPAITSQPASANVAANSSVTFSVTATGSHLSYQWHKDGSAIAGAISSSFSMASATATDAGVYTVVITNAAGSITSASATLTIASRSVAKPTGFFAMTGLTTTALAKADLLSLPYVSGMTSYIAWKDLEPTKGHYVFDRIDNDIALAKSYGKKLTLGVFTGKDSIPDWVAAEGVRMWVTGQGNTLIYPTDQTFVSLWSARVQALGARYADNDTVVQVTICGPTGTLCGPRYPELPPGVVYADLVSTWNQVIAAYLQAFPNTYKNFEVQLSTNGYNANLPVDLFAGIALDVKIGPFADFLSDTGPTDTSITGAAYITAAKGRNWCGFQMVSPLGDKIGDAILRGRGFGCNYFEIYTGDLQQQGAILSGLAL